MKRRNKIIIGAVAAVATFASLASLVGMRHRHHYGMHGNKHCMEQCDHKKQENNRPASSTIPSTVAPDTAR